MKKYFQLLFLVTLLFLCVPGWGADGDQWSVDAWRVDSNGDLLPVTTGYKIGDATNYPESISLGGVEKSSWGSVISPITDATGYVNPTDAGNYVRIYDAGYMRLGDATNTGDYYVLFSSDTDSWYLGNDDGTDDFMIGYGSTIGTTPKITIADSATVTTVTIGDGLNAYDKSLIFDGDAFDYYIAYDDSADDLLIGKGSAIGTTPAISITDGLAVSFYADLTMTGTTPTLTVGDAGAEDAAIVFDGNEYDFHVGLYDTGNDLVIGLGSALGTTPAILIGHALDITTYADITMTGTTPTLTVGDGGAENNAVYFNGVTDFTVGVDHTASLFEICNGADLDATVAISIDANEDIILPSGSLTIVDDEYINFGTDSDYQVVYDETTDDNFLITTTAVDSTATGTPMVHIVVDDAGSGCTADQEVFGIARGSAGATDLLTLDEDGDMVLKGTMTIGGVTTFTGALDVNNTIDLDTATANPVNITSTIATASTALALYSSADDITAQQYLLTLDYDDDGDADADYILCRDNESADTKFSVSQDGDTVVAGTLGVTGVLTQTAKIDLNNILDIDTAVADPLTITTSLQTATSGITIEMDGANVSAQQYGLTIEYMDDAQANCDFITCIDDVDGSPATLFTVDHAGIVTAAGGLTVSAGSVTLPAGTVSAADCAAAAKRFVITMTIADLSTASKLYVLPPKCTVVTAYTVVDTAITSADAVIELHKNGAAMTSGTITITADNAQGTVDTCTPSTNNTFNGTSDYLDVDNLGASTNASKCILTLHCTSTD